MTPVTEPWRSPWTAVIVVAVAVIAACGLLLAAMRANVSRLYVAVQDGPVLVAGLAILLLAMIRLRPRTRPLAISRAALATLAGVIVAITFAGHWVVLQGHDLSRDEQMASFDAEVFASGRLVAPLPEQWRGHAKALNTLFMIEAPDQQAWISAYLPMNAAIRALVSSVAGTPWLTGPLLAALGLFALWGCARRLWPDDREAAVLATLLYAASAQVLVTAMSSYAMTAHLAFNLVWLWLFLRRSFKADVGCLLVGFVATGLHQPLFHPMFAAPLLVLVVLERDWRRAALFLAGYTATGLFWFAWPGWIAAMLAGAGGAGADGGQADFLSRLGDTLAKGSPNRFQLMIANGLRFMAWQPLLLAGLLVPGVLAARRDRIAAALLGGIVLAFVAMLVLLPYQGHGFGYRYLHGLIGSAVLLAVFGFRALGEEAARWRALLVRSLFAGAVLILPFQLWASHASYAPQAQVSRAIAARDVDYYVVGIWDTQFSINLVNNPPDLGRRPVRLFADELDEATIAVLCEKSPTVGFSDEHLLEPMRAYAGWPEKPLGERNRALGARLSAAGCRVVG